MHVAVATCLELPEPDSDESPLLGALAARGIEADLVAWDDPGADFSRAEITLLRSTWNYALHAEAFLRWAEETAAVSRLINGVEVVRWNHHKRYLLDLESRGVEIAPTVYLPRGDDRSFGDVLDDRGWTEAVIKPAISAASYRTHRVRRTEVETGDRHLSALLRDRDALVQEYLPSVEGYGERSLIWVDGELTHAVRKSPRFGGDQENISDALEITAAERDLAHRALEAASLPLVYARIDMAPGPTGEPVLMELELMEPSLFLRQGPEALERLVHAIEVRL